MSAEQNSVRFWIGSKYFVEVFRKRRILLCIRDDRHAFGMVVRRDACEAFQQLIA